MFICSFFSSFMRLMRFASFLSCSDFFDFSAWFIVFFLLLFISRKLMLPNDSSRTISSFLPVSVGGFVLTTSREGSM